MTTEAVAKSPPLVMKFGGSAFAELTGYTHVARYAARLVSEVRRPLAIVVSAMSGTTGRLQQALDTLAPDPPAEAAAMLLTTGETVSVALLAAALHAEGVPAHPVPAVDTGLFSGGRPDRGELSHTDPTALRTALDTCPVVVIPGGQAVDADGRTVMLGRNSSDLSAVAVAAALGAVTCELFSDVPGVCTADPYLVPEARTLRRISYEGVRRMSRHGAKVVHGNAVDWAERAGVRLRCRPFPWDGDGRGGTVVGVGPEAAAVIVGGNTEVWRFRAASKRRAAAAELRAEGLYVTELDTASGTYLLVPSGVRSAARHLGAGRRHDDLCPITTVRADGRDDHVLVRRTDAAIQARRCHALLYPDLAAPPGPARPAAAKARSPHSDVLVGSEPFPAHRNGRASR
ncbi:hypothetical protein [Streptomyces sp. NPDC050704]|uniref:amino acid kinase family protein n=1 Tax=Streptomyces sp. NPDC050704 TaxID=3157219 RepID=UPI00341E6A63